MLRLWVMGHTKILPPPHNLPTDATYPEVTWSSDNMAVATVDQTGKVTGVGVGDAKIIARADGIGDTCKITRCTGDAAIIVLYYRRCGAPVEGASRTELR